MLFKDSGAGSFSTIWLAGASQLSAAGAFRAARTSRSNASETCQTCGTCGEQLCGTRSLQKAWDRRRVGYKAMHHPYAVAHAGFLEGCGPLATL